MKKANQSDTLTQKLTSLEAERKADLQSLKQQFHTTGESLKPANLIKSVVQDVSANPEVRSVFAKAAVGLILGLVAKKVLSTKKKGRPSQGLLASALHLGVNLLISNRYKLLKTAGTFAATALISSWKNRRQKKRLKNINAINEPSSEVTSFDHSPIYSYSDH